MRGAGLHKSKLTVRRGALHHQGGCGSLPINETTMILAVGVTATLSSATVVAFHWPLQGILRKITRDPDLAVFWTRFCDALLLLFPLVFVLLGHAVEPAHLSTVALTARCVGWGALGLIVGLFAVAALIASVVRPVPGAVALEPGQLDDLQRLLAKVDQIRAREILRRVSEKTDPRPQEHIRAGQGPPSEPEP